MVNEERVILMTKLASYEKGEGKKNVAIGNYFRGDYIGFGILKSIVSASIAFVILFGLYVIYDMETFMQNIYRMDLWEFGKDVGIMYLVIVGGYSVISYVAYAYRYNQVKKSMRAYQNNLKKLANMYDK